MHDGSCPNPPTSQVPLPPACQVGWFVSPAGEAFRALCGKLTCEVCAPRKLRRYRERLGRVTWSKMLTLTMPGNAAPLEAQIPAQAAAWRVLQRWLKRNANLKEYTWCREATNLLSSRINLHMHVILNSDYVPTAISKRKHKSLLNDAVIRAGFGSVFDITKVRGTGANYYVTKYVSKCTNVFPRYTRRLQTNVPDVRPREPGWHFMGQRRFAGPQQADAEGMLRLFGSLPESLRACFPNVDGLPQRPKLQPWRWQRRRAPEP